SKRSKRHGRALVTALGLQWSVHGDSADDGDRQHIRLGAQSWRQGHVERLVPTDSRRESRTDNSSYPEIVCQHDEIGPRSDSKSAPVHKSQD
ncbi:MAG: hypothetical protein RLZZ449_1458, partial [Actinomycetota bacterium]